MVLRSLQYIEHTLKAFRVGGFSQDLFDLPEGTINASLSKVEDFSFVMNERFDTVDQDELDAVQFSKTCGDLFQPMSLKTLDVRGPEVATQHALRIANFCGSNRLPRLQKLALGSITFASGSCREVLQGLQGLPGLVQCSLLRMWEFPDKEHEFTDGELPTNIAVALEQIIVRRPRVPIPEDLKGGYSEDDMNTEYREPWPDLLGQSGHVKSCPSGHWNEGLDKSEIQS